MIELQTKPIKKKMILNIDIIYWLTEEWSTDEVINVGISTKQGIEWEIFGCIGDYLPISSFNSCASISMQKTMSCIFFTIV